MGEQTPDELLNKLTKAVNAYYQWQRVGHSHEILDDGGPLAQFPKIFKMALPTLAQQFPEDQPLLLYIENVVIYGLKGLGDQKAEELWVEICDRQATIEDAAVTVNLSLRTAHRRLKSLPNRIARQLWRIDTELSSQAITPTTSPITTEQQRISLLEKHYSITQRQAEILLKMSEPGPRLGRKGIALDLFITINTLDSHLKKLRKRTNSKTSWECAAKARALLDKHGLGWERPA